MTLSGALRIALIASWVTAACMSAGCTKKPGKDELSKLEETKSAAESAEKKLTELKQERVRLETELQQKQEELKAAEEERDNLKKKTGK